MMSQSDRAILNKFAARVRASYPSAQVWAFGSRARGGGTWESDLDICVVLDQLDADIRTAISDIAWEVGFDHGLVISTVVFPRDMFERGRSSVSALVQTIREEGIAA